MCKQYQIEYTCQHTLTIETSFCEKYKSSNLLHNHNHNHSITIHLQHAPHKCHPCRTYDRDRWRRGWPPIPLPVPPPPPPPLPPVKTSSGLGGFSTPRVRKVVGEGEGDGESEEDGGGDGEGEGEGDNFAVVFEEGTRMGKVKKERVEHDEETGGVGLGFGKRLGTGMGKGLGIREGVVMSGGLNGDDSGSSEGFGLGIDGAGGGGNAALTPTTPTKNSTAQDLINKMRAQSFAEGIESGIRSELRSRFGGYGGKKSRERRMSTVEMGGVPMERTVSNRGSLALKSPRESSYRSTDMERGGGGGGGGLGLGIGMNSGFGPGTVDTAVVNGAFEKQKESEVGDLGLGLGLGLSSGFGGVPMEREGGTAKIDGGYGKTWLRKTRRESVFSKSTASTTTSEIDGTQEDDMGSVTARFLDF
ncbi:hypothetical protein ONS95_005755 [Cadophora gregata]|uniref:uncharacterized protein n=1 Tax=Cadophora gregata TaxID=51156 RepID=UPI0026DD31FB|nr:uncharacterized protein ONS95_005755 [Cadophora gregata]KAK0103749.1 hypothetical protein ONS95_005755 [Cadophora gregata]